MLAFHRPPASMSMAGRPVLQTATTSVLTPPRPAERHPLKRMTISALSIVSAIPSTMSPFPTMVILRATSSPQFSGD
jgi:hypothetical protein